jgi:signal transduction histidine kinase
MSGADNHPLHRLLRPAAVGRLFEAFSPLLPGSALVLLEPDGSPVVHRGEWSEPLVAEALDLNWRYTPITETAAVRLYRLLDGGQPLGALVITNPSDSSRPAEQALYFSLSLLCEQGVVNLHATREMAAITEAEVERERLIAELDAFSFTVAHDLKNPIGVIGGYALLLEENVGSFSPEEQKRYLRLIARGADKMNAIIGALLLLAGVRKMDDIDTMPLAMDHIIAEVLERQDNLVREYQAEILLPDGWPLARGYPPWVEEVWVNYVSNALKYGGRPPLIELGGEYMRDGMVRFWVRDNGPGLQPDEQARLFRAFTRLGQIKVEGHGLGLSIVQRIVDKLGGTVGVESKVGQGSLFYFTLPADDRVFQRE